MADSNEPSVVASLQSVAQDTRLSHSTAGEVAPPAGSTEVGAPGKTSYTIVTRSITGGCKRTPSEDSEDGNVGHKRPPWRTSISSGKLFEYAPTAMPAMHGDFSDDNRRRWHSTLIRFGPLSGLLGILLTLLSLFASLGVLAGSNGQAVKDWSSPPPTYLAIFTAIANLSMRYAAIQGVIIAWWYRAFKGSTLANLHWDWRSGTTLRGAITAGRHMGLLGVACIFSTIVAGSCTTKKKPGSIEADNTFAQQVVDGPLLQRASTVVPADLNTPVSLNINMVPEIPRDYTGYWATSAQEGAPGMVWSHAWNDTVPSNHGPISNYRWGTLNPELVRAAGDWQEIRSLPDAVRGCPNHSHCKVKIRAPALWPTSCTNHVLPLELASPVHANKLWQEDYAAPLYHDVFLINVMIDVSGPTESINLITGFATSDDHCNPTLNYAICTLESAIGEYEVDVQGQDTIVNSILTPEFLRLSDNAAVNHTLDSAVESYPSTLGGIVDQATKWNELLVFFETENHKPDGLNWDADIYEGYWKKLDLKCPAFLDPQQDVLRSLNQLMFYMGNAATSKDNDYLQSHLTTDFPVNYNATGYILSSQNVFNTDYTYFAGAAIIEIICILLILPTYYGWWKLGRPMSFSPLELAKAFEAPILDDFNSNSSGRDLANATKDLHVRYGVCHKTDEKTKLVFSDPAHIKSPQTGMRFDK